MATAKFAISQRALDVDRLGSLNERIKKLVEEKAELETKLRRRRGTTTGLNYRYTVFDLSGASFDHSKAKKLLGSKYDKCWTPYTTRSSKLTVIGGESEE